jgi:hypothetical protein
VPSKVDGGWKSAGSTGERSFRSVREAEAGADQYCIRRESERGQKCAGYVLVGPQDQDEHCAVVSLVDAKLSGEAFCGRRHDLRTGVLSRCWGPRQPLASICCTRRPAQCQRSCDVVELQCRLELQLVQCGRLAAGRAMTSVRRRVPGRAMPPITCQLVRRNCQLAASSCFTSHRRGQESHCPPPRAAGPDVGVLPSRVPCDGAGIHSSTTSPATRPFSSFLALRRRIPIASFCHSYERARSIDHVSR